VLAEKKDFGFLGATHVELGHALELAGDFDSSWRAFNSNLRNQIRKEEKSGLQFVAVT